MALSYRRTSGDERWHFRIVGPQAKNDGTFVSSDLRRRTMALSYRRTLGEERWHFRIVGPQAVRTTTSWTKIKPFPIVTHHYPSHPLRLFKSLSLSLSCRALVGVRCRAGVLLRVARGGRRVAPQRTNRRERERGREALGAPRAARQSLSHRGPRRGGFARGPHFLFVCSPLTLNIKPRGPIEGRRRERGWSGPSSILKCLATPPFIRKALPVRASERWCMSVSHADLIKHEVSKTDDDMFMRQFARALSLRGTYFMY
jgi:hypothetical protein